MIDLSLSHEFRPIHGSRRGEATAWILAVVSVIAATFAAFKGISLALGMILLVAFFVLSALLVSFGNWMERCTMLKMDASGVAFRNGLRDVRLPWEEVEKVQVVPGRWGDKVFVWGTDARFSFRTAGEVRWQGKVRDRLGFERGEQILEAILTQAGLRTTEQQSNDGYYYVRE